jgi:HEAT repeat protein
MKQQCRKRALLGLLAVVVLLGSLASLGGRSEETDPDVIELRKANLDSSDAGLLAFVRRRVAAEGDRRNLDRLVRKLGSKEFADREEASACLISLDLAAQDVLRKALKNDDPEIAKRAADCLESIESRTGPKLASVVVRVLLKRQLAGGVEAVVGYLSFAPNDEVVEAIYFGLDAWQQKAGKVDPALVKALKDSLPARRALAGCLVGRMGDARQQKTVARLLGDRDSLVRLRTAQGLLAGRKKDGIPTLIALLQDPVLPIAWQAEELLHYVAGEEAAIPVVGKGNPVERKSCREAWEMWWREKGDGLDLEAVCRSRRRPGLVLALEEPLAKKEPNQRPEPARAGRIWLCGCEGQPRGESYDWAELKTLFGGAPTRRQLIVTGQTQIARFQELKLCEGVGVMGMVKGELRLRFVAPVGNGNWLVAVEEDRVGWVHRLVELDSDDRTVWESVHGGEVGGVLVHPLVRVGFAWGKEQGFDLDNVAERIRLAKHPNRLVRQSAAEALFRLHGEKRLPTSDALGDALVELLRDSNVVTRKLTMDVLNGRNVNPSRVVPALVKLLEDPESRPLYYSIRTILSQYKREAIPRLLAAFSNPHHINGPLRRSQAIGVLATMIDPPDPQVHKAVRSGLEDVDSDVRKSAAISLLAQKEKVRPFIPDLVRLFDDPDATVRRDVIFMLQFVGDAGDAAVPDLIELLKRRRDRELAITTLGTLGRKNPAAVKALIDLLTPDQDVHVCIRIAEALGQYGEGTEVKRVVAALEWLLDDHRGLPRVRERPVQWAAVDALGQLGKHAKSAIPALKSIALEDVEGSLSQDAFRAIEAIDAETGKEVKNEIVNRLLSRPMQKK